MKWFGVGCYHFGQRFADCNANSGIDLGPRDEHETPHVLLHPTYGVSTIDTPILFLIFNRESTTRKVFEAIRKAQPKRLYIAADGPRSDRQGEAERCADVRQIATAIDWPCEVHTLFREYNLGCKLGPAQGISWFFQNEPEGIILEDDVLPVSSFFQYCEDLLARYRDDERVFAINGCNMIADRYTPESSYFFSRQNHVWGWASWRRAWQHYDINLAKFPLWDATGGLLNFLDGDKCATAYWRIIFRRVHRGEIDTAWDYQWMATCWMNNAMTILPAHNLTTNLGFGPTGGGTHTHKEPPGFMKRNAAYDISRPLIHPAEVTRDRLADAIIRRHVTGLSDIRCFKRSIGLFIKRLIGRGHL